MKRLIFIWMLSVLSALVAVSCSSDEEDIVIVDYTCRQCDHTPAGLMVCELGGLSARCTFGTEVLDEESLGKGGLVVEKVSDTEVSITSRHNGVVVVIPRIGVLREGVLSGSCDALTATIDGTEYTAEEVEVGGYIDDKVPVEEHLSNPTYHRFECDVKLRCILDGKVFVMKIWGQGTEL